FNCVDEEGHPFHPPGGDRDRLSAARRRGEVNTQDLQSAISVVQRSWLSPSRVRRYSYGGTVSSRSSSSSTTSCNASGSYLVKARVSVPLRTKTFFGQLPSGRDNRISRIDRSSRLWLSRLSSRTRRGSGNTTCTNESEASACAHVLPDTASAVELTLQDSASATSFVASLSPCETATSCFCRTACS